MARLEDLTTGTMVRGVSSSGTVTVVSVQWHGNDVVTLTYKDAKGQVDQQLIYRDDEPTLEVVTSGRPWDFDGDGLATGQCLRNLRGIDTCTREALVIEVDTSLPSTLRSETVDRVV